MATFFFVTIRFEWFLFQFRLLHELGHFSFKIIYNNTHEFLFKKLSVLTDRGQATRVWVTCVVHCAFDGRGRILGSDASCVCVCPCSVNFLIRIMERDRARGNKNEWRQSNRLRFADFYLLNGLLDPLEGFCRCVTKKRPSAGVRGFFCQSKY